MMDIVDKWVVMKLYYVSVGFVDYMCKLLNGVYQIVERCGVKVVVLYDFVVVFCVYIWKDVFLLCNFFDVKFNGVLFD